MIKNPHFPLKLRQARKVLGWSMDDLVERMEGMVSKQSISRYERGQMHPKMDVLEKMAEIMGVGTPYFFDKGMKTDAVCLRRTAAYELTKEEEEDISTRLAFWAERYVAMERESGFFREFKNPLKGMTVENVEDAIRAADLLRKVWNVGDGPICSVLRLLERKGVRIMQTELPHEILGLSTWADEAYPLIVLSDCKENTTVERTRFTALHELGHLLLEIPEDVDEERICNQFAGAFLLPPSTLFEEIGRKRDEIGLKEAVDLHMLYGVSVAALIHQALDLKIITREHYNWWFEEVIRKNRKEEGWGTYPFPETLAREMRISDIIKGASEKDK